MIGTTANTTGIKHPPKRTAHNDAPVAASDRGIQAVSTIRDLAGGSS